ncbi:hypothetical protein L7F22_011779, partial [Adiantum nelumboides]|nr:hypothetical protein [Adiantum nelumboides]
MSIDATSVVEVVASNNVSANDNIGAATNSPHAVSPATAISQLGQIHPDTIRSAAAENILPINTSITAMLNIIDSISPCKHLALACFATSISAVFQGATPPNNYDTFVCLCTSSIASLLHMVLAVGVKSINNKGELGSTSAVSLMLCTLMLIMVS